MPRIIGACRALSREMKKSNTSVYAAQASFFVLTSAVPFISIILSVIGLFLPEYSRDPHAAETLGIPVTSSFYNILEYLTAELSGRADISLLSISAIAALWSSSKGISAIRVGIESVYNSESDEGFIAHRLRSVFMTLVFIALIIATAALLLFGNLIIGMLGETTAKIVTPLRVPTLVLILSAVFTALFASIAKRSKTVPQKVLCHVTGAVFSSVGWIVFSVGYSLYIEYFSEAFSIYGGLAAIAFIMLWVYFCMKILLVGAVINKLISQRTVRRAKNSKAIMQKHL